MVFGAFFCYDVAKRKGTGEKFHTLKGGTGMTELEFGVRLKQLRQEKRLTQQELADQLGVSNKSVSRWESGGYPDITVLAPLSKALGVSVDELLGCQPPLRRFDRSDWQNLMSYAFALGGGVVFYLLDLFMPAMLCYLLYLAMMAYGVYLQRHYTYHSRWFYAANALMDFFVNLRLTSFIAGGSLLLSGWQSITLMMKTMEHEQKWRYVAEYALQLLGYILPWFFVALMLTALTQLVIERTAGRQQMSGLPRLRSILSRFKVTLSPRELSPVKLLPILSPVLLAGFWWVYRLELPMSLWVYEDQLLLFWGLWLVLTGAVVLDLAVLRRWGLLVCAGVMQLCCFVYPLLTGQTRAFSRITGRFVKYSTHLNDTQYIPFGEGNAAIAAAALVLVLLYLVCCMTKVELRTSKPEQNKP